MTYAYRTAPKPSDLTRWAYAGCPGTTTEDLMRSPDDRVRTTPNVPWRERIPAEPVRSTDGIGTMHPRTSAMALGKLLYALRVELGPRAYDACLGRKAKRTKAVARIPSKAVVGDVRRKADGPRPVVLSDHEMMMALGIQPIGWLD